MSNVEGVRIVDGGGAMVAHDKRWVTVHSARNPRGEADAQIAVALGEGTTGLLTVIGLGAGYILDALDARGWKGRVLAIEPEPELLPHLQARAVCRCWLDADRLRVFAAPDFTGAGESWRWFDGIGEEPPLIVNAPLARVRPEATARARGLLQRLRFDAQANARARREHGARYLLNTLGNITALAREGNVASLTGAAPGLPAIVVGAGPSLDANLDALRRVGNRALIVAVDTALRPLLDAGIAPQLVVAVDPAEANARHLAELPECSATHLVAEASLDPAAIEGFRGRTFLFSVADHEPWPWLRTHGANRGRLRAWGSVLTSAFDLALQMGCNPIAFAGADLAFTGGRPYCQGVTYEIDWRRGAEWGLPYDEQRRLQIGAWPAAEAPDVTGRPVRTAPHLVAFRDWLVEQIDAAPRVRFVNGTGAGILHGGRLEQQPLDALVAALPTQLTPLAALVRRRYCVATRTALLDAATRLRDGKDPAIDAWIRFADGLSAPAIHDAITCALDGEGPRDMPSARPEARATGRFDAHWIAPLLSSLPLVPMRIPPERMDARGPGLRLFRFRTTTARVFSCVLQWPDEAVAENGCWLRRARDFNSVGTGEYGAWRDQFAIRSTDGTDPRHNGRTYSVLVPEALAYVEQLPLGEVLAHHV